MEVSSYCYREKTIDVQPKRQYSEDSSVDIIDEDGEVARVIGMRVIEDPDLGMTVQYHVVWNIGREDNWQVLERGAKVVDFHNKYDVPYIDSDQQLQEYDEGVIFDLGMTPVRVSPKAEYWECPVTDCDYKSKKIVDVEKHIFAKHRERLVDTVHQTAGYQCRLCSHEPSFKTAQA